MVVRPNIVNFCDLRKPTASLDPALKGQVCGPQEDQLAGWAFCSGPLVSKAKDRLTSELGRLDH